MMDNAKEVAQQPEIDRRTLFARVGAMAVVGGAVLPAGLAAAQSAKSWDANDALIDAALHCAKESEACLAHCINSFKDGSTMLAECSGLVVETSTICSTLVTLASGGSGRLQSMARLTIASCKACEKECRLHAGHHAECKACADSCIACIEQCEALLA